MGKVIMAIRLSVILKGAAVAFVVLVGAALLVPSMSHTHRVTHRGQCAANLHKIGEMFAMYSNQFADQLPLGSAPFDGSWLCDQSPDLVDSLLRQPTSLGKAPEENKIFYCPQNVPADWKIIWGPAQATYRATGYAWLNDRSSISNQMPDLSKLPARVPPLTYHKNWNNTPFAGSSELVVDMIISDTANPSSGKWQGITAPGRPGTYGTNHMRSGSAPAGGNDLYFDGHVKFNTFLSAAATAVPQGNSGPYFWFPNP